LVTVTSTTAAPANTEKKTTWIAKENMKPSSLHLLPVQSIRMGRLLENETINAEDLS
jgi:hypothetical protein